MPDLDGDEKDGLDEALCPHDAMDDWPRNLITDDEIAAVFAEAPRGATIICKLDTCHSGNSTRAVLPPGTYRQPRYMAPPTGPVKGKANRVGRALFRRRPGVVVVPSMVEILLAGCRAEQTSADALLDSRYTGAFSWALKKAWRARPAAKLAEIHAECLALLAREQFEQAPQLEAANPNVVPF